VHRPTSLQDFVAILRRRAWIIGLAVVVTPLTAIAVSEFQPPLYRATAKVLVNRASIVSAITNVTDPSTVGNDPTRFLTTQSDIARSPVLIARVINDAGVPGVTVASFLRDSSVDAAANADLLNIAVSSTNRSYATRLADVYAQNFTKFKTELDTARINDALETLKSRIEALAARGVSPSAPSYATLLQYESQLETVGKLLANNTQVLNPAAPEKVRPRPRRNAMLGVLIGVVVGIGLALLAEALDRRIRVEKDIEDVLQLPLLGRIARPPRRVRNSSELVSAVEPRGAEAERFRKLRTRIEFENLETDARALMVTSAVGQEGKSTTIANLAVTFARNGRRVALVDLDLRRPFLDKFFRIDSVPGVTDVIMKRASLREAMRPVALAPPSPRQGTARGIAPSGGPLQSRLLESGGARTAVRGSVEVSATATSRNGRASIEGLLNVLPAGTPPFDAGEFVENEGIAGLIEQLREEFDYVLIDAPPVVAVGDAMTLSSNVDAIIVVTRLGVLRPPLLDELARQLDICQTRKLGFVLTGAELEEGYGYADHYYAYAPSRSERGEQHVG
jgi:polysaccharide biosynthesis transport protein